jgi:hypothetical protein
MPDSMPHAGQSDPDDPVRVVDGTFVGYEGRVIGPDEATQLGLRMYPATLLGPIIGARAIRR